MTIFSPHFNPASLITKCTPHFYYIPSYSYSIYFIKWVKSWIDYNSLNKEKYIRRTLNFLDFAFANSSKDGKILCPCTKCVNCKWCSWMDVYEHIISNGFLKGYVIWIFHDQTHLLLEM